MPRVCTICAHPNRAEIDKALVSDTPNRRIATQYNVTEAALRRHAETHLPASLVVSEQVAEEARAMDVMAEVQRIMERVNLLYDACDRWLRDPQDPTRYEIGPRSEEVNVIYTEPGPMGTPVRKKEPLSELLDRVERGQRGLIVRSVEVKHADPRDLLNKTADRLRAQLELIAKLLGELDDRPQINVIASPEWLAVRGALLSALAPYPEARIAVAGSLQVLEASRN